MAKAAKSEKFHTQAGEEIYELLGRVIEKYHRDFGDSEFIILFKHGGWSSKGRTVFANFKVLGDDLRSTWGKDAILYLNSDMWKKMSEPQRLYILDEALYGLDFKYDRHSSVKEAPDGRALLTTVPPDIKGFTEVIKRHGAITEDVKRLAKALTETNQLTFDDMKQKEEEASIPPHEGIKVVVGQGGVVEGVEDKNQLTLEQVAAAKESGDLDPIE